jgi:hypothetical protein
VVLAGLVALAFATTPPPSLALTEEIDRAVERSGCVRAADQWPSRYYVWERPAWVRQTGGQLVWFLTAPWLGSDTSRVSVTYHEAASPPMYLAGLNRLRPDQQELWLDCSNARQVWGTYEVRTRKLINWSCESQGN